MTTVFVDKYIIQNNIKTYYDDLTYNTHNFIGFINSYTNLDYISQTHLDPHETKSVILHTIEYLSHNSLLSRINSVPEMLEYCKILYYNLAVDDSNLFKSHNVNEYNDFELFVYNICIYTIMNCSDIINIPFKNYSSCLDYYNVYALIDDNINNSLETLHNIFDDISMTLVRYSKDYISNNYKLNINFIRDIMYRILINNKLTDHQLIPVSHANDSYYDVINHIMTAKNNKDYEQHLLTKYSEQPFDCDNYRDSVYGLTLNHMWVMILHTDCPIGLRSCECNIVDTMYLYVRYCDHIPDWVFDMYVNSEIYETQVGNVCDYILKSVLNNNLKNIFIDYHNRIKNGDISDEELEDGLISCVNNYY